MTETATVTATAIVTATATAKATATETVTAKATATATATVTTTATYSVRTIKTTRNDNAKKVNIVFIPEQNHPVYLKMNRMLIISFFII